jgi:hypothetical protein
VGIFKSANLLNKGLRANAPGAKMAAKANSPEPVEEVILYL